MNNRFCIYFAIFTGISLYILAGTVAAVLSDLSGVFREELCPFVIGGSIIIRPEMRDGGRRGT